MRAGIFLAIIVIGWNYVNAGAVVWGEVLSCDSCGRECMSACGTRHFRTCCFNYLKKRTTVHSLTMDPSLRVELWLARSRSTRNSPHIAQTQLKIEDDSQGFDTFKDVNLFIQNPNDGYNDKIDENLSNNIVASM